MYYKLSSPSALLRLHCSKLFKTILRHACSKYRRFSLESVKIKADRVLDVHVYYNCQCCTIQTPYIYVLYACMCNVYSMCIVYVYILYSFEEKKYAICTPTKHTQLSFLLPVTLLKIGHTVQLPNNAMLWQ